MLSAHQREDSHHFQRADNPIPLEKWTHNNNSNHLGEREQYNCLNVEQQSPVPTYRNFSQEVHLNTIIDGKCPTSKTSSNHAFKTQNNKSYHNQAEQGGINPQKALAKQHNTQKGEISPIMEMMFEQLKDALESHNLSELNRAMHLVQIGIPVNQTSSAPAKTTVTTIPRIIQEKIKEVDFQNVAEVEELLRHAQRIGLTPRQVKKLRGKFKRVNKASQNIRRAIQLRDLKELEDCVVQAAKFCELFPRLKVDIDEALTYLVSIANERKKLGQTSPQSNPTIKTSKPERETNKDTQQEKHIEQHGVAEGEENGGTHKKMVMGVSGNKINTNDCIEDMGIKDVILLEKEEKAALQILEQKLHSLKEQDNQTKQKELQQTDQIEGLQKLLQKKLSEKLEGEKSANETPHMKSSASEMEQEEAEFFRQFYEEENLTQQKQNEQRQIQLQEFELKMQAQDRRWEEERKQRENKVKEEWDEIKKNQIAKKKALEQGQLEQDIKQIYEDLSDIQKQQQSANNWNDEIKRVLNEIEEKRSTINNINNRKTQLRGRNGNNYSRSGTSTSNSRGPGVHGHSYSHSRVVNNIVPTKLPTAHTLSQQQQTKGATEVSSTNNEPNHTTKPTTDTSVTTTAATSCTTSTVSTPTAPIRMMSDSVVMAEAPQDIKLNTNRNNSPPRSSPSPTPPNSFVNSNNNTHARNDQRNQRNQRSHQQEHQDQKHHSPSKAQPQQAQFLPRKTQPTQHAPPGPTTASKPGYSSSSMYHSFPSLPSTTGGNATSKFHKTTDDATPVVISSVSEPTAGGTPKTSKQSNNYSRSVPPYSTYYNNWQNFNQITPTGWVQPAEVPSQTLPDSLFSSQSAFFENDKWMHPISLNQQQQQQLQSLHWPKYSPVFNYPISNT